MVAEVGAIVVSPRPMVTISGDCAFGTGSDCAPRTSPRVTVRITAAKTALTIVPPADASRPAALLVRVRLRRYLSHHFPNRDHQQAEYYRGDDERKRRALEERGHLLELLRVDVTADQPANQAAQA